MPLMVADNYDAELRRLNDRFCAATGIRRTDCVLDIGCGAGRPRATLHALPWLARCLGWMSPNSCSSVPAVVALPAEKQVSYTPILGGASVVFGTAAIAPDAGGMTPRYTRTSSDGPLTDRLFRAIPNAIGLVPVGHAGRFAGEVVRLADQPAQRASLARAGERLYYSELDWPVTARRLLSACARKS